MSDAIEAALTAYRETATYPIVPGNHSEAIRAAIAAYQAKGGEVVADEAAEWDLELRAFNAANSSELPKHARELIKDLWAQVCLYAAHPKPDGIGVKGLEWSEVSPPNAYCSYHHTFADTPFGRYQIEWKGWKDHPSYTLMFRDSDFIPAADDLDLSKAAAFAHYETRIRSVPHLPR